MQSFLNVITLQTYTFFIMLTPQLHGHSKRFFRGSSSGWPRLLRVVFTQRSAFFELSHPWTHIFHIHNAITACLTQLSMHFDWFHATQVEESDNHALFFKCKRRHFSIKNITATPTRHKHSTGSTVLSLGLAQPKEQPRLLQQLSRFYLLPFRRKKLGYLRTWTPHAQLQNTANLGGAHICWYWRTFRVISNTLWYSAIYYYYEQ